MRPSARARPVARERPLLRSLRRYHSSEGRRLAAQVLGLWPGVVPAHREVLEETGIRVGEVKFHSSQPWPFPHSLMLGCIAQAESSELSIDPNEIAEARWFTRADARLMLERRHPDGLTVPGKQAIANALIGSFVDAD